MIPLQFGLVWCGKEISYLRYLTFKSLRFFHPDSKIQLYIFSKFDSNIHNWAHEKQDFERKENVRDYTDDIKNLGVEVIRRDFFGSPNFCPVYQADLFRWWWLYNFGGFYMDTDQIVLKNLSEFTNIYCQPDSYDFVYSQFKNEDRPHYSPTGFLGCCKNNEVAQIMMKLVPQEYSADNYNSSGPLVLEYALLNLFPSIGYNAPFRYFYPVNCSRNVDKIFDGSFRLPMYSYCLHWYAGHPLSQEFNSGYTEEFAKTSNDSISVFLREAKII
jgi:hypothetical protein